MITLMTVTLSNGTLPESIREGAFTDNFNRSATWIFVNGKTEKEIEQKLHDMVFDYVDGDMNVYCSINANENIGFDDTENVRLTQWSQNGHYYLYVPEYISWTNAYLRAQTYKLAGQEGYLATIGSLEEARYLINLNNNQSLWIGGTRLLLTNDDKRLQNTKLKTVAKGVLKYGYTYYWAGGPEAGSDINKNIGLSGASFDMQAQCFGCLNNTLYDIQGYESCMQLHPGSQSVNDIVEGNYVSGAQAYGFVVEFGGYAEGQDPGNGGNGGTGDNGNGSNGNHGGNGGNNSGGVTNGDPDMNSDITGGDSTEITDTVDVVGGDADQENNYLPNYADETGMNGDSMNGDDASAVTTGNANGNGNGYGNGYGYGNGGNAALLQSTYQWYPVIRSLWMIRAGSIAMVRLSFFVFTGCSGFYIRKFL